MNDDTIEIPNQLLQNPEISLKAKGMLCLLLTDKKRWTDSIFSILQMTRESSKTPIKSGIKELEEEKYLLHIPYRGKETKMSRGSVYLYSDVPNNFPNIREVIEMLKDNGLEPITFSETMWRRK